MRERAGAADVVKYHDGTRYLAMAIVYGRGRILNRRLEAVSPHQDAIRRQAYRFVFPDCAPHRIAYALTRRAIDELKYVLQWASRCIFAGPAGQTLRDQIQKCHVPVEIRAHHRVADRIEGDLRPLFFVE